MTFPATIDEYLNQYEPCEIEDIALKGGGVNGLLTNLVYYSHTSAAYERWKDEIWDIVEQINESNGENILEYLIHKHQIESSDTLECWLVWLAVEQRARERLPENLK